MYYKHKNSAASFAEKTTPKGCFIEKTKGWYWIITILVVVAFADAILTSSWQEKAYSADSQSFPQGGQFQNTALAQCPYCPGFLDAQGRCNVRECPIYSPDWGKTSSSASLPVRKVLIKELAMEVGASQGKDSVIIQAVYPGGNAEKAGLQVGDGIVRFNGRKVKNVKRFHSIVTRAKPESEVKIKILRNNQKIETTVMIGEGEMEGVTVPKI